MTPLELRVPISPRRSIATTDPISPADEADGNDESGDWMAHGSSEAVHGQTNHTGPGLGERRSGCDLVHEAHLNGPVYHIQPLESERRAGQEA